MRDRRADILARLEDVLGGLPDYLSIKRNYAELLNSARPALVLLDGDEADEAQFDPLLERKSHRVPSPIMVRMQPEIYIAIENKDPALYGDDLNARRLLILQAVLNDYGLLAIVGNNGSINYRGCTGQLQGQRFEGLMRIMLTFTYPLIPSELQS